MTIGWGRNLSDRGLSHDEAEFLLENDIAAVVRELNAAKPALMTNDSLSHERKDALYNMAFNLGIPKLLEFKKMWAALENHDYATAAKEALNSRWATQVRARAERIVTTLRGDHPHVQAP